MSKVFIAACIALAISACSDGSGTEPPAGGWANHAPTRVERVVTRETEQLLEVSQGALSTWVRVPRVDAEVGDYVLLSQGSARTDVEIAELGARVPQIVDIAHVRVVDLETAQRTLTSRAPRHAVAIEHVYAKLDDRTDAEIVVYGTAVKVTGAIDWYWVHLRDGTGDAAAGTHDLTVQTKQIVTEGQRVAFRGTLRGDVDLGFGYHYDALVEAATLVTD